jgi:hypothetical protein
MRLSRLLLIGTLLLLPGCALGRAIYHTEVTPEGHEETVVCGLTLVDQPPAPPGQGETEVWQDPRFAELAQPQQLQVLEGWNAIHAGTLPPPGIPWGALLGTLLAGASGSNLLSSVLGAAFGAATKGAANVAVAIKPSVPASWPQAILAGLSLLSPIHGVGPEASAAQLAAVAAAKPAAAVA